VTDGGGEGGDGGQDGGTADEAARAAALAVLAGLIAGGGAARFLLPPVVPGAAAFPEPWQPTAAGVTTVMRRLADHAGLDRRIVVEDARRGAPPTERKPATELELLEVDGRVARCALGFLGRDDVAGTLAHEIGVIHGLIATRVDEDPYRVAEPPARRVASDVDLERGSIATIYLGLGVLAANAAFQQYTSNGRVNGAYIPLEYDVLRAGHVPMSRLTYLLAVQATVRGDDDPPDGLQGPQRDEVAAWLRRLRGQGAALRGQLGIDPAAAVPTARPPLGAIEAAAPEAAPAGRGLRWHTHRGGVGFIAGLVFGGALGVAVVRAAPVLVLVGGVTGHVAGRRVRVVRCSACATVVDDGATSCRRCGATLRGDIAHLNERLEVEERLDDGDGRGG
jgi:hypothetical protein